MKKVLLIILIIALITGFIALTINIMNKITRTPNEEIAIFDVDNILADSNQEVTITVKMKEDSNFVAANFELLYDSNEMEYIKYEKGDILEQANMSIVNKHKESDKISIGYVSNPNDENTIVKSGDIVSITFKIKDEISNTEIIPELKCTTLKEKDGTDIKYVINQGKIVVK